MVLESNKHISTLRSYGKSNSSSYPESTPALALDTCLQEKKDAAELTKPCAKDITRLDQREKLEDSDAEESFVADSQPKGTDVGCSSDTKKKRSSENNRKACKPVGLSLAGTEVSYNSLGVPSYQCRSCNATMWYEERNNKGNETANPTFSLRCQEARIDHSINVGRGLYTFHINGQNYHRIGSLLPQEGTQPRYTQLWFFDTQNELRNRLNAFVDNEIEDNLDVTIVGSLLEMLNQNSSIAQSFLMAKDWCHSHSSVNVELHLLFKRTSARQYNTPTVAKVLALITNDFGDGDPTRHINNKIFGESRAVVYVIEFQKRGLPHADILLWLEDHYKCRTPEEIHDIISAELPLSTDNPTRYKAITDYMLYDPCGKDARSTIVIQEYMPNGHAVTTEKVAVVDEIKNYLNCRYLAPCEAVWCMLSFDIHYSYLSVMKLNFHLPNQQPVTLRDSESLSALLEREGINVTMFTDWFALNERNPPARAWTYAEIPQYYVLYERLTMWKPQKQRKCIGRIVYSTPASGIASLLLLAGRTAHSRFVIPLELLETSTCGIKQNTHLAELIQEVELIIWDEAPMTQKYAFEALDKTLKDILGYPTPTNRNKIFGGLTVLLGGDFRQILPVIPKGKRLDIVQACINRSDLWKHCKVFTLTRSMQVNKYYANGELDIRKLDFNQWVLAVGDGKLPAKIKDWEDEPTWIQIPEKFLINASDSPIA
ncbi:ATP-dependent DNA helicase PIF1-like protein [Tanacetum coccineum]